LTILLDENFQEKKPSFEVGEVHQDLDNEKGGISRPSSFSCGSGLMTLTIQKKIRQLPNIFFRFYRKILPEKIKIHQLTPFRRNTVFP
jgi:hypothetical protein